MNVDTSSAPRVIRLPKGEPGMMFRLDSKHTDDAAFNPITITPYVGEQFEDFPINDSLICNVRWVSFSLAWSQIDDIERYPARGFWALTIYPRDYFPELTAPPVTTPEPVWPYVMIVVGVIALLSGYLYLLR